MSRSSVALQLVVGWLALGQLQLADAVPVQSTCDTGPFAPGEYANFSVDCHPNWDFEIEPCTVTCNDTVLGGALANCTLDGTHPCQTFGDARVVGEVCDTAFAFAVCGSYYTTCNATHIDGNVSLPLDPFNTVCGCQFHAQPLGYPGIIVPKSEGGRPCDELHRQVIPCLIGDTFDNPATNLAPFGAVVRTPDNPIALCGTLAVHCSLSVFKDSPSTIVILDVLTCVCRSGFTVVTEPPSLLFPNGTGAPYCGDIPPSSGTCSESLDTAPDCGPFTRVVSRNCTDSQDCIGSVVTTCECFEGTGSSLDFPNGTAPVGTGRAYCDLFERPCSTLEAPWRCDARDNTCVALEHFRDSGFVRAKVGTCRRTSGGGSYVTSVQSCGAGNCLGPLALVGCEGECIADVFLPTDVNDVCGTRCACDSTNLRTVDGPRSDRCDAWGLEVAHVSVTPSPTPGAFTYSTVVKPVSGWPWWDATPERAAVGATLDAPTTNVLSLCGGGSSSDIVPTYVWDQGMIARGYRSDAVTPELALLVPVGTFASAPEDSPAPATLLGAGIALELACVCKNPTNWGVSHDFEIAPRNGTSGSGTGGGCLEQFETRNIARRTDGHASCPSGCSGGNGYCPGRLPPQPPTNGTVGCEPTPSIEVSCNWNNLVQTPFVDLSTVCDLAGEPLNSTTLNRTCSSLALPQPCICQFAVDSVDPFTCHCREAEETQPTECVRRYSLPPLLPGTFADDSLSSVYIGETYDIPSDAFTSVSGCVVRDVTPLDRTIHCHASFFIGSGWSDLRVTDVVCDVSDPLVSKSRACALVWSGTPSACTCTFAPETQASGTGAADNNFPCTCTGGIVLSITADSCHLKDTPQSVDPTPLDREFHCSGLAGDWDENMVGACGAADLLVPPPEQVAARTCELRVASLGFRSCACTFSPSETLSGPANFFTCTCPTTSHSCWLVDTFAIDEGYELVCPIWNNNIQLRQGIEECETDDAVPNNRLHCDGVCTTCHFDTKELLTLAAFSNTPFVCDSCDHAAANAYKGGTSPLEVCNRDSFGVYTCQVDYSSNSLIESTIDFGTDAFCGEWSVVAPPGTQLRGFGFAGRYFCDTAELFGNLTGLEAVRDTMGSAALAAGLTDYGYGDFGDCVCHFGYEGDTCATKTAEGDGKLNWPPAIAATTNQCPMTHGCVFDPESATCPSGELCSRACRCDIGWVARWVTNPQTFVQSWEVETACPSNPEWLADGIPLEAPCHGRGWCLESHDDCEDHPVPGACRCFDPVDDPATGCATTLCDTVWGTPCNAGKCVSSGFPSPAFICECNEGITGLTCNSFACDPPCQRGSTCEWDAMRGAAECRCHDTFGIGLGCAAHACPVVGSGEGSPCNNQGACIVEAGQVGGTCASCNTTWHGCGCEWTDLSPTTCEDPQLTGLACTDNGVCDFAINGTEIARECIECDPEFIGTYCEVSLCLLAINGSGICNRDTSGVNSVCEAGNGSLADPPRCNCNPTNVWELNEPLLIGPTCEDNVTDACAVVVVNVLSANQFVLCGTDEFDLHGSCELGGGGANVTEYGCECFEGFEGPRCLEITCVPACVHGLCDLGLGECECFEQGVVWEGGAGDPGCNVSACGGAAVPVQGIDETEWACECFADPERLIAPACVEFRCDFAPTFEGQFPETECGGWPPSPTLSEGPYPFNGGVDPYPFNQGQLDHRRGAVCNRLDGTCSCEPLLYNTTVVGTNARETCETHWDMEHVIAQDFTFVGGGGSFITTTCEEGWSLDSNCSVCVSGACLLVSDAPTPAPAPTNATTPAPTTVNGTTPAPTTVNGTTPAPTTVNGTTPAPTAVNGTTPAPTSVNGTTSAPTTGNTSAPSPAPTALVPDENSDGLPDVDENSDGSIDVDDDSDGLPDTPAPATPSPTTPSPTTPAPTADSAVALSVSDTTLLIVVYILVGMFVLMFIAQIATKFSDTSDRRRLRRDSLAEPML